MPAKDKAPKELINVELPPIPEHLLVRHPPRWVQVHFKLVSFSALDDVVRLPQTATLHMIESKIVAHHGGSIDKVSLWKDEVHPKNLLRDFTQTIKSVWKLDDALPSTVTNPNKSSSVPLKRGAGEYEDHQVVVWYDYRAHDSDCPLLLRSPRYNINPTGAVGKKEDERKR